MWTKLSLLRVTFVAIAAVACSSDSDRQEQPQPSNDTRPAVVDVAVADLAQRLGIDTGKVEVAEVLPMQWSDSCLGVSYKDKLCAAVITPGYWVALSVDNRQYEYHTNNTNAVVGVDFVQDAAVAAPATLSPTYSEPPAAYLSTGSARQTGEIGSYCWSGNGLGACVDKIGLLVPDALLTVRQGDRLFFEMGLDTTRATIEVWPLSSGQIVVQNGYSVWQPSADPTILDDVQTSRNFAIDSWFGSGRYIVALHIEAAPGSASYGFLIEVGG